jgi:peptide/nickel transport system substrate-binding protein
MIYDTLTQTDVSGAVQPMLATEWEATSDTTWVFNLRPDVKFHDGTTMTAEDVAYSLNRLLFDEHESLIRASFLPFISKVEATGDLEVTITSPQTDPLMPLRLTSLSVVIMPQAYTESAGFEAVQTKPVGAGPYKVVDLVAGDRLVLEAHGDYWGGAPAASEVTVRLIPETSTRVAALQSGEVDLITTVSPDLVEQIDGADGLRIDRVAPYNWMLIYFNTNKAPSNNVHLRKALSLAIDRESIARDLWNGYVRVMNDYFIPGEFGYDPNRPIFPYDPEEAARELELAGYANEEFEFTPPSVYYTNASLVSDVINEMWKAVGVNVKYEPLETAQWADRSLAGNNIATLQSFGTSGDPATGIAQVWNGWVATYYTPDEEFQRLALEAGSSLDSDLRYANYRAIADIVDRDTPIAPLYQSVEFYGVRDGITWEPHQQFTINLRSDKFSF